MRTLTQTEMHLFSPMRGIEKIADVVITDDIGEFSESLLDKRQSYEQIDFVERLSGKTAKHASNIGEEIVKDEKKYIEVLLNRRIKGANLARNSMIFLLSLSFIGWLLFFYEKRVAASYKGE